MSQNFSTWVPSFGNSNSMIYILFATSILLTCITFMTSREDILYPPFVGSLSFSICIGLAALYTNSWLLPMHFNTTLIIVGMVLLFLLGGFLATETVRRFATQKNDKSNNLEGAHNVIINCPWAVWLMIILLLLYFLYCNYIEFKMAAIQVTSSDKFSEMLFPVSTGIAHGIIKFSKYFSYRLLFAKSLAYTSTLFFEICLLKKDYKNIFRWGTIACLYIPYIILTAGRQLFLYFILFSLISLIMIIRREKYIRNRKNELYIVVGALVVFFMLFVGVGILNGKITLHLGLLKVLAHYAGVNIAALDVYLNEMNVPDTPYIGTLTLNSINAVINHFGHNLPTDNGYISLFTVFGEVSTNVYTSLFRYIADYGFIGCSCVMFLLGFGYTFFYEFTVMNGYKNWMILLYSLVSYPIFLLGREERFFNEILANWTVYTFAMMILYYKFIGFINREKRGVA